MLRVCDGILFRQSVIPIDRELLGIRRQWLFMYFMYKEQRNALM